MHACWVRKEERPYNGPECGVPCGEGNEGHERAENSGSLDTGSSSGGFLKMSSTASRPYEKYTAILGNVRDAVQKETGVRDK